MKQPAHTVKTFRIEEALLVRHRHVDRWRQAIPGKLGHSQCHA
jgi:hypothetical protein